jgi:hypothetical protein
VVDLTIAKLKNNKLLGHDQIPAEMIQAGGEKSHSVWNMEEFPNQWKESIIVPT